MEAAKLKYTENILDNKSEEKTYLIEDGLRELEYSGKVDGKGVLKIDKTGKIELAIYNDKWCIRKSKEESKLEVEEYKDKCIIPGIAKDPVITLNGEASITLKSGEVYEEQGVIAKTVEGKVLEYTTVITLNDIIVESVDTSKTGTYKITYSTSSNGKTATITRIVTITDGIGPVITFEPEIVNVKSTEVMGYNIYIGVSVEDNVDGVIEVNSENVKTKGELGEEIGEYKITYIVKDSNGNVTEKERTFRVVEAEGPTLNFSNITTGELWTQEQEITIYANDPSGIKEFSYEVYKNGLSSGAKKVKVSGNSGVEIISLNQTGRYTIRLQAIDQYDNESKLESGVYKIDVIPPILTLKSTESKDIFVGTSVETSSYFNEPIYSLSGGSMSCNPTNTKTLKSGTQTVSCTVKGGSELEKTLYQTINVVEQGWVRADINSHGSIVNIPTLANGLIPIKYKDSSDTTNRWYDYETGMWANAVAVKEEYRNIEIGKKIPEDGILAYFVWIPKYEYQYTNLGDQYAGGTQEQPGEIKVKFISKNQTSASYNYKIHPAFTFGYQNLSGIWVGKFETTGSATVPTIKPNLTALVNQNINDQFETAKKFSVAGNNYGLTTIADSHMMKNSEWGAVAYLSQSKYGKYGNINYTGANKKVFQNRDVYGHKTGCSSGNQNIACYKYDLNYLGTGASTTGTIYGVYDMNGGSYENVMGVYRGNDAASTWGASTNSNYAGFSSAPLNKYYDEYTTYIVSTACNGEICYGHALSETAGWYNNLGLCVSSSIPWFSRGGYSGSATDGIFEFNQFEGANDSFHSFRVVLLDSY